MTLFYRAFIESVISYSIICWYGNLGIKDKNSLAKTVKEANKIVGVQFSSLNDLFNKQVLKKASAIHSDCTHPLNFKYTWLPSGLRLSAPVAKKTGTRIFLFRFPFML